MKRLRGIVLLLAAGAVLNVLVAWTIAVSMEPDQGKVETIVFSLRDADEQAGPIFNPHQEWHWDVEFRRRFGTVNVTSSETFHSAVGYAKHHEDDVGEVVPEWASLAKPVMESRSSWTVLHSVGHGWPLVTLVHDELRTHPRRLRVVVAIEDPTGIDHGIALEHWPWPSGHPRVLPLRPAWRGFVVNTVF